MPASGAPTGNSSSPRTVTGGSCVDRVTARGRARARCPVTGAEDVYEVTITYTPVQRGDGCIYVEAYSLADYLESFHATEILQEDLTRRVAETLCSILGRGARVRVATRGPHGGVELEAVAELECGGS